MEESPFHSASASPSGLRSSRTELYPLNLQRPRVGQIKPPKWAKPTCQKQVTDECPRHQLNLERWHLPVETEDVLSRIGEHDWDLLTHELLYGRSNDLLTLQPKLLLRHAAGQLFQEAHYEAHIAPQLRLPGFAPAPAGVRGVKPTAVGVHFTPPSLARMVVEQAFRFMSPSKSSIHVLDPACGSGEFLREALRQVRLSGFKGDVYLTGYDVSEPACIMATFVLNWERNTDTYPVHVEVETRDSLSERPWHSDIDVIVMNPPFVSYEQLTRDQLMKIHSCLGDLAHGRIDLSAAFVWKANQVVNPQGIVATVIPASFLEAKATSALRTHLTEQSAIEFVARLGSQVLFREALVDTGALVLKKGGRPEQHRTTAFWADHRTDSTVNGIRTLRRSIRTGNDFSSPSLGDGFSIYSLPPDWKSSNWSPRSYEAWQLLRRLHNLSNVAELFHVHTGARPGYLPAFVIDKARWALLPKNEKKYFRPAVVNASINFGQLLDLKYVFYAYGHLKMETETQVRREMPEFYSDVLLPNKSKLLKRRSKRTPSRWWEMSEPREWQHKREPKIVSVYFGRAGSFAYDETGDFVVVQGFAWLPKLPNKAESVFHPNVALAYLALLNSPVMDELLSAVSNPVQGGQWDLSARFVKKIALPNLLDSAGSTIVPALTRIGSAMVRGDTVDEAVLKDLASAVFGIND
jgi:adenine-specific DNA-methyltransferase